MVNIARRAWRAPAGACDPAGMQEPLPRRVGILVPGSNTTCETELNRAGFAGLTFHCARMALPRADDDATMASLLRQTMAPPIGHLGLCQLDAAMLCCTSASMALGPQAARGLMEGAGAPIVLDVGAAIVAALQALGLRRIALFTPYREVTNQRVIRYLAAQGIATTAALGLGLNASPELFRQVSRMTPERLEAEIAALDHAGADGILICCSDMPTLRVLPALESRCGKPVVSSNQATAWAIARAMGEGGGAGGRLFDA